MKTHKGMRPQDVVILLKLAMRPKEFTIRDLAGSLAISGSEVSESISRSQVSGLLKSGSRQVNIDPFLKFLEHGMPYVFPAQLGPVTTGIYTAHSESSLYLNFSAVDKLVWADEAGKERGSSLQPLYPTVVKAAMKDRKLYRALALCDILRVGDASERSKAVWHLRETFGL